MKKPYCVIGMKTRNFDRNYYETLEMAVSHAGDLLPREGETTLYVVKVVAVVRRKADYEIVPAESYIEY